MCLASTTIKNGNIYDFTFPPLCRRHCRCVPCFPRLQQAKQFLDSTCLWWFYFLPFSGGGMMIFYDDNSRKLRTPHTYTHTLCAMIYGCAKENFNIFFRPFCGLLLCRERDWMKCLHNFSIAKLSTLCVLEKFQGFLEVLRWELWNGGEKLPISSRMCRLNVRIALVQPSLKMFTFSRIAIC